MRALASVLGLIVLLLAVVAGLAWANNIGVTMQWSPDNGHDVQYEQLIPLLKWSAVDISTISTFIPLMGLLLISFGFFRIRDGVEVSKSFPFYPGYNNFTVALGLIGTVWGLIMIGYYNPKSIRMEDLIQCLHTALFSTLVALTWVYVIIRPIKVVMCWMVRVASNQDNVGASNVVEVFEKLAKTGSAAKNELQGAKTQVVGLKDSAAEAAEELATLKKIVSETGQSLGPDLFKTIKATCGKMDETLEAILSGQEKMGAETITRTEFLRQVILEKSELEREIKEEREERKSAQSALVALIKKTGRDKGKIDAVVEALKSVGKEGG